MEKASKNAFQLTMEDGSYLMVIITDTTEVTGDALLEGGHAVATYDPATQTGLSVPAVTPGAHRSRGGGGRFRGGELLGDGDRHRGGHCGEGL